MKRYCLICDKGIISDSLDIMPKRKKPAKETPVKKQY